MSDIPEEKVESTFKRLNEEAEKFGYHLGPDTEFVKELVRGLLANEETYGYWACPCRLPDGNKADDMDMICPCYYRDADIDEYGTCYCALYVSDEVKNGTVQLEPIPDRRPPYSERKEKKGHCSPLSGADDACEPEGNQPSSTNLPYPVWRCRVCGYLAARDEPPQVCPICKAAKERFERFM